MKILRTHAAFRVEERLRRLYGERADSLMERFKMLLGRYGVGLSSPPRASLWSENDVLMITYADTLNAPDRTPLRALREFCGRRYKGLVSRIHILPFCPWSSDDGFSVIDYRAVDSRYGSWENVEALGNDFPLMFDLVLNHCSRESQWFRDFVTGIAPARHYFLPTDPKTDLTAVVRPRSSPLLSKTTTRDGEVFVWTTFSEDQVDLNWKNPDVLFEFLDILFLYLAKGVSMLRLDAVAFLWKELGTDCLHRPETHEVVKLLRDVLTIVAPDTILLTETNVPHKENISYFGEGDEAHMVYNFTLPPLLLYSLLREDAGELTAWAQSLPDLPKGQAFLNFTASHDGIGVRPLQGILPDKERDWLVEQVRKRGGRVSRKRNSDGSESPYELNITYVSATGEEANPELGRRRFLCSQAVMLSMRGIPAIYIHSLLGTPNDEEAVKRPDGYPRAINRHKYTLSEVEKIAASPDEPQGKIHARYTSWLRRRTHHTAFHPEASQEILSLNPSVFGFVRTSQDGAETIVCLFNFTTKEQKLPYPKIHSAFAHAGTARELLSSTTVKTGPKRTLTLAPYQAVWLALRSLPNPAN